MAIPGESDLQTHFEHEESLGHGEAGALRCKCHDAEIGPPRK